MTGRICFSFHPITNAITKSISSPESTLPSSVQNYFFKNKTMLGTVTVLVWKQLGGGIYHLYDILSGFGLCTLAVSIVSVLNEEPVEVVVGTFDNDMQVIEYYQRMVYQDSILVPYTLRGKKAKIHIAFGHHFIG